MKTHDPTQPGADAPRHRLQPDTRGSSVLVGFLALLTVLAGCGGTYAPSRAAPFDVAPEAEINDEDVRKAFEARPQVPDKLHVAYYAFDDGKAQQIGDMLRRLPRVESVYRIPALVVTGERRYDAHPAWQPAREVSLKKLRLLAARARADILVVADDGYRWGGVNGLVAFSPLLVPMLFTPFLDNEVESYFEAFVIDVRNGYLYGHVTEETKSGPRFATIYADTPSEIFDEQWKGLETGLEGRIKTLLAAERATQTATPRAEASAAPAAQPPAADAGPAPTP